uniref:Transposase n=1 Tax=Wolbachia endosymbiont of Oeneis ivallda TaxID=3171168 RepID=A0AAU7YL61_9RICK
MRIMKMALMHGRKKLTRSYIEVFFYRLKQIFGFGLKNKSEVNREKELLIKCYLLNKFIVFPKVNDKGIIKYLSYNGIYSIS